MLSSSARCNPEHDLDAPVQERLDEDVATGESHDENGRKHRACDRANASADRSSLALGGVWRQRSTVASDIAAMLE
jgi:hypothetical protein